jgi:hypothetical protein
MATKLRRGSQTHSKESHLRGGEVFGDCCSEAEPDQQSHCLSAIQPDLAEAQDGALAGSI